MPRHAVIQNGVVVNCVEYPQTPSPVPGFPDDVIAVPSDTAGPGWLYANNTFSDPQAPSAEALEAEQWVILRHFRNRRLALSDWTQVPDTQLAAADVTAWQVYRQALRDLPAVTDDPETVDWPTAPDGAFA